MQVRPFYRRVRFWHVLIVLAVVVPAAFGAVHTWAWYHWRAAKSELAKYHPEAARDHLVNCLRIWGQNAEVLLLASRAARQSGDLETATQLLRSAQKIQVGSSKEIALEWALLQAASGDLREAEDFLQRRTDEDPDQAPLIWEAVTEGYIRVYRVHDALSCLENWLAFDPDNVRALELRGMTYQSGKQTRKAAEDYTRVIERDPTRKATRWRLALCLLDSGGYDLALPHLRYLEREQPDDPDVQVRIAICYSMLGKHDESRQLLDAVLAAHPTHAQSLRTRGHFAMIDRRMEQAEEFLRRAAAAAPDDYKTQFFLYNALEKQNKTEAAAVQLRIAEAAKERAERLGDLTSRRLHEQPLNPALHYEMGMLLMRSGHKSAAEGWLLSAVQLDPDYSAAHAELAKYYESQGDAARAAEHHRLAEGSAKTKE